MARILLVDDEEGVRKEWKRLFEEEGYEVTTAGSKEEAYAIILTQPTFEVAVVDMCLRDDDKRGEDGVKVIEKLKGKDLFIQVIAVTAYMSVEEVMQNIREILRFGPYQYMSKIEPGFLKKLLEEIEKAIEYRKEMIERFLGRRRGMVPRALPIHQRQEERDKKLIEGLQKYKILITQNQLDDVLREKERTRESVEAILLRKRLLSHGQIAWILGKMFDIDFIYVMPTIDTDVVQNIPAETLIKHRLIPIAKVGKNVVVVAADPQDEDAIREIERVTGCKAMPLIGSVSNIIDIIKKSVASFEA